MQPVDVAALGETAPPLGHVALSGMPDAEHAVRIMERRQSGGTSETIYVPIVAARPGGGAGPDRPVRFFIKQLQLRPDETVQTFPRAC